MASKRHLRRRGCESKRRYGYDEAKEVVSKKRSPNIQTYRCRFGNHWHVGHVRGQTRKLIKARQEGWA